jgi:tetratricopeptide (TPR) repeat protein
MRTLFIAFFLGISCVLSACNLQTNRNQVEREKEAVAFKLDSAEVYEDSGVSSYLELSELDKFPVVEFEETIQVKPRAKIYRNLGASYFEQGKIDEAVVAFKKAVQIDPSFVEAHYLLADVYSIKGEGVLSRKFLDQAMALDGSYIIDVHRVMIIDRKPDASIEFTIKSTDTIELPPVLVPGPIEMDIPHK